MTNSFRDQFKFYKRKDTPLDMSNIVEIDDRMNPEKCTRRIQFEDTIEVENKIFGMKKASDWFVYQISCVPGNVNGISTLKKLRWATFGYHHNWNTKVYSESSKSEFPPDLKRLCHCLADILNFKNFDPQAAILNLYNFGSSLSGHTDHSEVNLEAPLFSFSFGQSAIFLIGGKTVEENAVPLLIESGDIIIMSQYSRLCYHGIPRIIAANKEAWNSSNVTQNKLSNNSHDKIFDDDIIEELYDSKQWTPYNEYVNKNRINLNIRQVLLPGQQSLDI
ncbi:hypothetical protein RUM43_011665 [Polyplax serrata]|uniref:Alpha-ketoglutarate-dependent dioxygenase AlkB-like domain-containing protein n=1 Tax=Polyplax serrata TaxID=468196 RepID=A0AAN8NTF1_POLSC